MSGRSDHLVASRNRWVNDRRKRSSSKRDGKGNAKQDCDQGDRCWTEACERLARRMSKYLDNSEGTKLSTRELEEQLFVPKGTKGQCRAHRKASQEREEGKVISNLQAKRR